MRLGQYAVKQADQSTWSGTANGKDTKVQVVIRNHIHCRFVANEPARGASVALGAQAFDLPPLLLLPATTVACIARRRGHGSSSINFRERRVDRSREARGIELDREVVAIALAGALLPGGTKFNF